MEKTFLVIILFCAGQMRGQNKAPETIIFESRGSVPNIQISTLKPFDLNIESYDQSRVYDSLQTTNIDLSNDSILFQNNSQLSTLNSQLDKDPVLAWLISFPVGALGLHRAYLGTSAKTVVLYILTAGGFFGIVPMVDWILLLKGIQNGDISKYVGNRKFIMWL